MTPFGFGGKERTPDTRDFNLGKIQAPSTIPATYMPDISTLATYMQEKLPTCGANSFAWFQDFKFKGKFSPRYTWIGIKKIDGYPLEDGTDMRSIFKSGASDGVCDLAVCPDDSTLDVKTYSDPKVVTPMMQANAQPNIIQSYAFLEAPFTMSSVKQAIYNNKVVLALVNVGEEWYTPTWNEKDILPLRSPKAIISGHFIVLYGYDEKYIYFKNSWGPTWGKNGSGYFGENYLPYIKELGTAIDEDPKVIAEMLNKISLLKTQVSLWQRIKALLSHK